MTHRDSAAVAAADVRAGESSHWRASLRLAYRRDGARTVAQHAHEGPLRILKSLYPEGEGVCHHVIVHPPGGNAGGDHLGINIDVGEGAHALATTPGAARFYRSRGEPAVQTVRVRLRDGARFEWLPMETIVHDGALASNELCVDAAPGASMIGWDLVCLGLPASAQAFRHGRLRQCIDIRDHWLEQARIDALDQRLMQGPLGLAGRPVFGAAWLLLDAAGERLAAPALGAARALIDAAEPAGVTVAVTRLGARLLVARVLAYRVEPAMALLRRLRGAWRRQAWQWDDVAPRVWAT
jgi:urease accessory protein